MLKGSHSVLKDITYANIRNPNVIFRGFGDSSLNFELRCFIRDIKDRKQIMSDLYFEIDRLFRENNVEIPFPQRDLHIRSSVPIPPSDTQE